MITHSLPYPESSYTLFHTVLINRKSPINIIKQLNNAPIYTTLLKQRLCFPRKTISPVSKIFHHLSLKKAPKITYNLFYFLSSVFISFSEYKNQSLPCNSLPNGSQSHSIAGSSTLNHPGKAKILLGFRQQAGGQSLPPASPLLNLLPGGQRWKQSDSDGWDAPHPQLLSPSLCIGAVEGDFQVLFRHTCELCSGSV